MVSINVVISIYPIYDGISIYDSNYSHIKYTIIRSNIS